MARPTLLRHRKFARLARLVGSRALALGHLELLWSAAYESGDDRLGDATDVEAVSEWAGDPGKLAAALVEAGFVDREGETYRIHDLWDHAPDYVAHRREKEVERHKSKTCQACGAQYHSSEKHSKFCTHACRSASWRVTKGDAGVRHSDAPVTLVDAPPAPAPAPAPALGTPNGVPAAPNGAATKPRPRRQPDPALEALKAAMASAYRERNTEDLDWPSSAWGDVQAIRKSLADDAELLRRWGLFLASQFWPIKSVHKFRDAYPHPRFKSPLASVPATPHAAIPEFK